MHGILSLSGHVLWFPIYVYDILCVQIGLNQQIWFLHTTISVYGVPEDTESDSLNLCRFNVMGLLVFVPAIVMVVMVNPQLIILLFANRLIYIASRKPCMYYCMLEKEVITEYTEHCTMHVTYYIK